MATPRISTIGVTDTLEMADVMKKDQGYHETEVSFGGETDLQKAAVICIKNPNHTNFIPIKDFNIEHLPLEHRDSDIVELIRAWVHQTCRVSVTKISDNRPEFFTGTEERFPYCQHRGKSDMLMTGTGWVRYVYMYTKKNKRNCECAECLGLDPTTRKKEWAKVFILTAAHVVSDNIEAAHASCEFFYDDGDTDVSKLPKLTGSKGIYCDMEGDYCEVTFLTHDLELVEKLYKMYCRCRDLENKLYHSYYRNYGEMFMSRDSYFLHKLAICVSHPHGCSKMISLGQVTHRETIHTKRYEDGHLSESTQYKYTTPTCPGSSGARVFIPGCKDWRWVSMTPGLGHVHSGGHPGNANKSAAMEEKFPPPDSSLYG